MAIPLKKTLAFLFLMSMLFYQGFSQTSKKEKKAAQEALVKQLVENKDFVFVARTVNPTGGRSRQLTNDYYTLTISKDSVISDLPYFGRAYTAPIGSAGGGISFTSIQFDITSSPAKKGGWNISIKPKDISDIRQVSLIITTTGNTTVNVQSNSRQSISYNGDIEERKKK